MPTRPGAIVLTPASLRRIHGATLALNWLSQFSPAPGGLLSAGGRCLTRRRGTTPGAWFAPLRGRSDMRRIVRACLQALLVCQFLVIPLRAQESKGTLVIDVKPIEAQTAIKPKVESELKSGGLEWGVENDQLVVSMVSKRFVAVDLTHLTRYGTTTSVDLPPGHYRLTCVAIDPSGGLSVDKFLSKGAYFNLDVVTFDVAAGETTTIAIRPLMQKKSTFLVKFFYPDLLVRVLRNGVEGPEYRISARTETSIAWDSYHGPLKFGNAGQ